MLGRVWHQLSSEGGTKECQTRWKYLRNKFSRLRKKKKRPSGSAANKMEHWDHYELMTFFAKYIPERGRTTNWNLCGDDTKEDSADSPLPHSTESGPVTPDPEESTTEPSEDSVNSTVPSEEPAGEETDPVPKSPRLDETLSGPKMAAKPPNTVSKRKLKHRKPEVDFDFQIARFPGKK